MKPMVVKTTQTVQFKGLRRSKAAGIRELNQKELHCTVVGMAAASFSNTEIFEALSLLKVPRLVIRHAVRRFKETGLTSRRPGQGRPRSSRVLRAIINGVDVSDMRELEDTTYEGREGADASEGREDALEGHEDACEGREDAREGHEDIREGHENVLSSQQQR